MDPATLFLAAYETHRAQIEELATALASANYVVTAEVTIEVEREWRAATIYTGDFVVQRGADGPIGMVELSPNRRIAFPPFEFKSGGTTFYIEELVWDRIRLEFPSGLPDLEVFNGFLNDWHWNWRTMDLPKDDGVVHSIYTKANWVEIDFGSAPPKALFDVIELISALGFPNVKITSEFDDTN